MKIVGIDTGGTFTDFIVFDGEEITAFKLPSTPKEPHKAICEGIKRISNGKDKVIVIHGTTVATNSLLENKLAKTLLITNKGFEDIIEIGRQARSNLYDLKYQKRKIPLEDDMKLGLECRIDHEGNIIQDLKEEDIKRAVSYAKYKKADSVSVCFLHSYKNPEHEIRIKKALEDEGFFVSSSHEISNEIREYERFLTTTVNASLLPIISAYLNRLKDCMPEKGDLFIMHSNGGILPTNITEKEPVKTVLSGPAGGVIGASYISNMAGYENIITFDMGGTSTDVSLVKGFPSFSSEIKINELPLKIPSIEIHTVGAGGGSIAYLDEGGALKVGPQSVGADPGPACYGKGDKVAVTDANVVLGRLIPEFFLGGSMKIFPERSEAVLRVLTQKTNKDMLELAEGIVKIANLNMEKAVRVISVEKGYNPKDFTLVSFGGGGGLHAIDIAKSLGIKKVLIPQNPGLLSAMGLILADFIRDYTSTIMINLEELKPEILDEIFKTLENKATKDLEAIKSRVNSLVVERYLDMRYKGQSFEVRIKLSDGDLRKSFEQTYKSLYGYTLEGNTVEVVNARLRLIASTSKPNLKEFPKKDTSKEALILRRNVFIEGKWVEACVYDRDKLNNGSVFEGPAVIVEYSSTTFVPAGCKVEVDKYRNLIIEIL